MWLSYPDVIGSSLRALTGAIVLEYLRPVLGWEDRVSPRTSVAPLEPRQGAAAYLVRHLRTAAPRVAGIAVGCAAALLVAVADVFLTGCQNAGTADEQQFLWQTFFMERRHRPDAESGRHLSSVDSSTDDEEPTERHGDFAQADWDMRFLSALTHHLSARPWDAGIYEIEQLDWADSIMTLVVRVWGRDRSGLGGWREHLPTVRSGFTPDDPERVAGAWHSGEFYPCYLPDPHVPDENGIHWVGRGRPSHPDNLR